MNIPIPCDDGNMCTTDTCNTATGCVFTPNAPCNDNNKCTDDSCNPATGCVYTPIVCNDNSKCTDDSCNPATGCVYTPIVCNDNSKCTDDSCNTATGCVYTPIVCNDNSKCTDDSCNTATGCVFTPIVCNDNDPCTDDTCNAATGCVYTPKVCNDNNTCTTDACVNGSCVYTPVTNGTACTVNGQSGTCQSGTCAPISTCPSYAHKSVKLNGTGQSSWIEKQIVTEFTVSGNGCILAHTDSSITVSTGTVLKVDWRKGKGPQPTSVTWTPSGKKTQTLDPKKNWTLNCPSTVGTVGALNLNNSKAHGKDYDTLTLKTATY
jgi:hypothetical protein